MKQREWKWSTRRKSVVRSADGSTELGHEITKPTAWTGGGQILKKEEEVAKPLGRCEEKRKEWSRQSTGNVERKCKIRKTSRRKLKS